MPSPPPDDHIDRFVIELLSTGSMLRGLISDLTEALPGDAYPGEELAAVVVEMVCGTIRTTLSSADPRDVRRATELIGQAKSGTLEHLQLARDLSRRIHGDDRRGGRAYG